MTAFASTPAEDDSGGSNDEHTTTDAADGLAASSENHEPIDPPRPPDDSNGRSVSRVVNLSDSGFTLVRSRFLQINGVIVKIISVVLLDVRDPGDGPDEGHGPGGGGVGPLVPAPRGGLDGEADVPPPDGGLLSIHEVFGTA